MTRRSVIALTLICSFLRFISQVPPSYSITAYTDESTGYYFFNAAKPGTISSYSISYNMILDRTGELVYFRKFSGDYKAGDFKLQPNGIVSYFSNDKFYLMDKSFRIIDSVSCPNGVITARQDLQILPDKHFLLLGYEEIQVNLSADKPFKQKDYPANSVTTVSCGIIQELDAKKNLVFEWRSKDHFKFTDMDTFFVNDPKALDWTHCNAVEQDKDGNLLLSTRNFSEITKINRMDGSIMWRLGGNKNQFAFKNDPGRFTTQHDIRRLPDGNITLYDNGRESVPFHPAIAKEYTLDEKNMTATLVWKYINDSTVHSGAGLGNVQRLPNGNTLVNHGRSNRSRKMFTVVTPSGNKCFEVEFNDVSRSYRAFNYSTVPFTFKRPVIRTFEKDGKVYLDAGKGYKGYLWSNGATTQTIPLSGSGRIYVGVKTPDGGYVVSSPYTPDPAGKK